jgi:hypothetical protein
VPGLGKREAGTLAEGFGAVAKGVVPIQRGTKWRDCRKEDPGRQRKEPRKQLCLFVIPDRSDWPCVALAPILGTIPAEAFSSVLAWLPDEIFGVTRCERSKWVRV